MFTNQINTSRCTAGKLWLYAKILTECLFGCLQKLLQCWQLFNLPLANVWRQWRWHLRFFQLLLSVIRETFIMWKLLIPKLANEKYQKKSFFFFFLSLEILLYVSLEERRMLIPTHIVYLKYFAIYWNLRISRLIYSHRYSSDLLIHSCQRLTLHSH